MGSAVGIEVSALSRDSTCFIAFVVSRPSFTGVLSTAGAKNPEPSSSPTEPSLT